MFALTRFFFTVTAVTLLATISATSVMAQGPNPAPATPVVSNVQVTVPVKEAEVGQTVKVTAVATDAAGTVLKEQPSAYFAGPFDIAATDDDGNVKLFGIGQVTVGAIVGGKPGFTTFMVKAPGIKTIDITPIKAPLAVGTSFQVDAVTRLGSGDPRTGVPVNWTSDNAKVA